MKAEEEARLKAEAEAKAAAEAEEQRKAEELKRAEQAEALKSATQLPLTERKGEGKDSDEDSINSSTVSTQSGADNVGDMSRPSTAASPADSVSTDRKSPSS